MIRFLQLERTLFSASSESPQIREPSPTTAITCSLPLRASRAAANPHCGGNCGAGMAAAETVEFGFFPQGKTGKPVVRTDRMETVSPSGQKLVDIALMPYVPYDFIFRHIEYAVKGDSQFDDSEIRGKMPAIFGDGVDNRFPEFRTECSQLPGSQSLQVFGRTDIIQYFFVHILSSIREKGAFCGDLL